MHLQWIPRPGTEPEDDLIVFPGDFTFEHVPECTSGRVYLLTFKPTKARRFFWMQDLKTDQDEERVKKVVDLLNKGPSAVAAGSAPRRSGSNGMGNMDQEQLLQMFMGGARASTATPAPAAAAAASTPAVVSTPAPSAASTSAPSAPTKAVSSAPQASAVPATPAPSQQQLVQTIMGAMQQAQQQNLAAAHADVDLSAVLDPAKLQPFLRDPEVLAQLMPHLPESQRTVEALEEQLGCAQMQQATHRLEEALQSEQMATLLAQFGLPNTGDIGVGAFLRAIEKQARDKKQGQ
jgi:hypothetical protein